MTRRRVLLVSLLATAVACGYKNRPIAPELVRPQPPLGLIAASVPEGVKLSWQRPEKYTGGARMNDLGRFLIERAPGDAPTTFSPVGEIQLDDQGRFRPEPHFSWVDTGATEGQSYAYRVTAFTLDKSRSTPAGPVTIRFERKVAR